MKKELAFVTVMAALSVGAAWPGFAGNSPGESVDEQARVPANDPAIAEPILPRYDFGPRIIQVPQRQLPQFEAPAYHAPRTGHNEGSRAAVQRKITAKPPRRKYHASSASPSQAEKRAVLSVAPLPDGPSPVRATPRWREPGK